MAIILRYFAEFGRFHGQFRTSGWLAVDLLSPDKCQSTPTKHDGRAVLFAVAELLVQSSVATRVNSGRIFNYFFIANSLLSVSVKEFLRLVRIWQSNSKN